MDQKPIVKILFFVLFMMFSLSFGLHFTIDDFKPIEKNEDGYLIIEEVGFGVTFEEAEKSALSNCVKKAVGSLLRICSEYDSELLMLNGENMKKLVEAKTFTEEMLSLSKAYVHDYAVVEKNMGKYLWTVTIQAEIRFYELGTSILRVFGKETPFDFEEHMIIYELERETNRMAGAMTFMILKDFGFSIEMLNVSEYELEISKMDEEAVYVNFKMNVDFDMEKYFEMRDELEEVLAIANVEPVLSNIQLKKLNSIWQYLYLYDLPRKNDGYAALRFLDSVTENEIIIRTYFLNQKDEMQNLIFRYVEDYYYTQNHYSISLSFKDNFNRKVFEKKEITKTPNGLSLIKETTGFLFTSYTKLPQFLLLPRSLRVETGTLKISENALKNWSMKLKIPRENAKNIKKIEFEIEELNLQSHDEEEEEEEEE